MPRLLLLLHQVVHTRTSLTFCFLFCGFLAVRLSCYPPRQRRIQHISVGVFFDVDISCSFYPEPNLVDSVTVEVAPALKAPAPQTLNFNTVSLRACMSVNSYSCYSSVA